MYSSLVSCTFLLFPSPLKNIEEIKGVDVVIEGRASCQNYLKVLVAYLLSAISIIDLNI